MTDLHKDQSDKLDQLLTDSLVVPPADFTARVMSQLTHDDLLAHSQPPEKLQRREQLWTSAAITASAAAGVIQVISFILGIWIPATAG